jgi:hypothetical protein
VIYSVYSPECAHGCLFFAPISLRVHTLAIIPLSLLSCNFACIPSRPQAPVSPVVSRFHVSTPPASQLLVHLALSGPGDARDTPRLALRSRLCCDLAPASSRPQPPPTHTSQVQASSSSRTGRRREGAEAGADAEDGAGEPTVSAAGGKEGG